MLVAILRPFASEILRVTIRYDVVVAVLIAAVSWHFLACFAEGKALLVPHPAERRETSFEDESSAEDCPKNVVGWTRAFVLGLLIRIHDFDGELRHGFRLAGNSGRVEKDFADISVVLLSIVGLLFMLLIPLLALTWWLLDHPAVPREPLNQVLSSLFGLLLPLEQRLRPLLSAGFALCSRLGLAGAADHELLERDDAVARAKRLLFGLALLNVCLSIVLLVLLSAVSSLLRMV
mmetsp:Transcript_51971/g.97230  ORF Transcript_51971/g.97230 Transcript_51971/m.97230 type:complete len:234 (+) Transcript_51971:40-741(+)